MPPMDINNSRPTMLKETRESKGLTLDIVHEATKIPLDALKAIEEGYSLRMMSPFYYRGFIKMYAEFLGLNVAEVQAVYGLQPVELKNPALLKTTISSKLKKPPSPQYMEQFQEWLNISFSKKNVARIGKVMAFIIVAVLLFRVVGCVAGGIKAKLSEKPKVVVAGEKKLVSKKQDKKTDTMKESAGESVKEVKSKSVDSNPGDSGMQGIKVAAGHMVSLAVRASKDTPIQVKADGTTIFQMTMKKGTMESWVAKEEIILSGKNINELDMEVNNKHVGTLGNAERKAKKVVITKDGLTVKK